MKKIIPLLFLLASLLPAQTPVKNVQKGDSTNHRITENLTFGTGRTLKFESGATFHYAAGASFAGDAADFRTDLSLYSISQVDAYFADPSTNGSFSASAWKIDLSLDNVTNNAQTQAAIVPNTAPAAGQVLVGNAGGTAYAPVSISGDIGLGSDGATTVQANSIALGTDTTGNYVATITDSGAGEVTVANSGTESAAITLAIASSIARDSEVAAVISDTEYDATSWNGVTGSAPSKNAVRDKLESLTAANIANVPAGAVAASTVQAAIDELDTEKAPLASPGLTGTPTAPTASAGTDTTQIATTAFVRAAVDTATQALDLKASVRAISTTNLTLSGTQTVDGVALVAGDRILVAGQTTGSQNGIYVVAAGAWTRAADADTSADVTSGMFAFVSEGTANGSNGYVLTTPEPIVLGTTALTYTQFSGAGQIIAGTGLAKSGNTLSTSNIPNASLANSAITIAGTSVSLGGSITLDTITGLGTAGLVKRSGSNAFAVATAATDYVAPSAYASANGLTMATARLLGRTTASTGAAEEISVGASLSLASGTLQLPDTITAASVGSSTAIPVLTYDAKGRLTAASTAAVIAPAGTLSGTTLAANVVTSSLTTVGALNAGSITSGFGAIDIGSDALTAGATSVTTLSASGTANIGGGTAFTTGTTIKPASDNYQLTLLQSNTNAAGWGLWADTSGNLKVTRYGSSTYGTAALTIDLNSAASFSNGLSVTGVITTTKDNGGLTLNNSSTGNAEVYWQAGGVNKYRLGAVGGSTPTGIRLYSDADGAQFALWTGTTVLLPMAYSNTTASAANVFVDTDGTLKRSTSSLRYKTNVRDYDRTIADVMRLRPIWFDDKRDGRTHAGLAAEEVDAAGLKEFVEYDKDGRPDAIGYGHMVSLAFVGIQDHEHRLKAIEAKLSQ